MASLNLGAAASLINESSGSSLKLRIGFRNKRVRRVAEKWRFRVQQMSGMEQMTKHELARSAKRSESLRQILKQYGISVESPENNKTSSSRLDDDLNCQEKHDDAVPSSVIDDSETNTTEELLDLSWQEKHGSITEDLSELKHHNCKEKHDAVIDDSKMNTTVELSDNVSTTGEVSGQHHHRFPHLKTGALFTSSLLPVLGFCMLCIIGTLHAVISSKTSRGHHDDGSKTTRWETALMSERNGEPVASDEHDTSPEYTVSSAYHEATNEVDEACSKVEREYKRKNKC
ncbi:unnamed protein product [Eruca vesicaria subsp. sativa]|uniref:Transmembrane protein n=1 Tax=Eruca vesicaria subsp. sativa TaxID=29727 RepID=A0ABC8KC62_ERUVS|nr:unnamed protein product [Eruca vesicaria subsp. sativa]